MKKYLYYDKKDSEKIVTVISDEKINHLGDNYIISENKEFKDGVIYKVDESGEIIEEEADELKQELKEFKIQSALAQAEVYEKQEQDKLTVMAAIAEAFEMGVGQ